MAIPLEVVESHSLTRQGPMALILVRNDIALIMIFTTMSFSDIDGITSTRRKTRTRWCRHGTHLSPTI